MCNFLTECLECLVFVHLFYFLEYLILKRALSLWVSGDIYYQVSLISGL